MKRKKHPLTLIEIMIVIVLIGLIGSVIGVNMNGSLEKGRAFKTELAMEQIQDILMLEVARGTPIEEVVKDPETYLAASGLVKKKASDFLKDGWGFDFEIKANNSNISVTSERYKTYTDRQKAKRGKKGGANKQEQQVED